MAENPFAQFAPAGGGRPTNPFAQFAAPLAQPATFQEPEDEKLYRQELTDAKARWNQPRIPAPPEVGSPASPEEAAIEGVQRQRGIEGEQKAFDATRTPARRIMGAGTFIASMVSRMATRGEYGLGDVAGVVSGDLKKGVERGEADFARANAPGLEYVAAAGDIAAGVPMLSTMGAVPRGIAAMGSTIANKPLPAKAITRAVTRNERLADIDAFKASGVEPFGPALTEAGTAGAVKQLSEAPIVGTPIRNRLERAITETRDAGERVASEYGDARTYRDVGNVAEQGINRFKDARSLDTIENTAAKISDERLAEISSTPARETSIKTKQDTLYERAWRNIPPGLREDGAVLDKTKGRTIKDEPALKGGMTNARALLDEIQARNTRMVNASGERAAEVTKPIASSGLLGGMLDAIQNPKWNPTLGTMRDIRSSIRRLASGMSDTEKNTLSLSDTARLQSAITQDMVAVLRNNADRFAKAGESEKAASLSRAEHAFKRADQFTKASVGRLESIEKLYGAQSAEQLGLSVFKDAMGGRKGGNFARLTALRRSLKDDEWGDISSGIIREMGRPVGSARGLTEDAGFSVNSAITNWKNMSEEGKNVLFNQTKDGKALRGSLDNFVRVADRMANFEALVNSSRSATNAFGLTALFALFNAVGQAAVGNVGPAAALATPAAGSYAFGKFMSSPTYVRWLTRATELSGSPDKLQTLRSHARGLAKLAEKEPDQQVQNLIHVLTMKLGDATNPERMDKTR